MLFEKRQINGKMNKMEKTAALAKREIGDNPVLAGYLADGVINYSALARRMLPKLRLENPKASEESLAIALKRLKLENAPADDDAKRIIAGSQISARNGIAHMTFHKSRRVLEELLEISKRIDSEKEDVLLLNQGAGEVTVIVDEKNVKMFSRCKGGLVESTGGLALITIREDGKAKGKKSIEVPGIYAHFLNRLAQGGINVVEVVSTYSQVSLVVSERDLARAYGEVSEGIDSFRK